MNDYKQKANAFINKHKKSCNQLNNLVQSTKDGKNELNILMLGLEFKVSLRISFCLRFSSMLRFRNFE
jgi:hypothetical protein